MISRSIDWRYSAKVAPPYHTTAWEANASFHFWPCATLENRGHDGTTHHQPWGNLLAQDWLATTYSYQTKPWCKHLTKSYKISKFIAPHSFHDLGVTR